MAFDYTWDHVAPMTGTLDDRSSPDLMEAGSWRSRVNLISTDKTTLARMPGFGRYGSNNADLHDQLIPLCQDENAEIEIPSMLAEIVSTSGNRRLVAATRSRIYALNEATGNWVVLAYGLPGGDTLIHRWTCATLSDAVVFTNDYDPPLCWAIGDFPESDTDVVVEQHPCVESLGITKVGVVHAWKGFCLFGDVEMDGTRYANRILWSNYDDALDFDPGVDGTSAGQVDLEYGERILAMTVLGDYLLIYTNKGIWQATVVSGEEVINFRKAFSNDRSFEGILVYRRTLINLGDAHVYCGADGVYLFGLSMTKPERPEWIYQATKQMWENLDESKCDMHVAGYDSERRLLYISYADSTNPLALVPNKTLVLDMKNLTASFMDAGFFCYATYRTDSTLNYRDFLLQYCVCSSSEVAATDGLGFVREGLPASLATGTGCAKTPDSIYHSMPPVLQIADAKSGAPIITEDPFQPAPSMLSLCNILEEAGITKIEDFCRMCETDIRFLGFSSKDWCLKDIGEVFARDICLNTFTGAGTTESMGYKSFAGTYQSEGYYSALSTGPIYWNGKIRGVRLYYQAVSQASPAEIVLTVGTSNQPFDPLVDSAQILWHEQKINKRYLRAQSDYTGAQHVANKTVPVDTIFWPLDIQGKYVYIDLKIKSQSGTAPTAAVATFSRLSLGY